MEELLVATLMNTEYFQIEKDIRITKFNLSKNRDLIREIFYSDDVINQIGLLDYSIAMSSNNVFVWEKATLPPEDLKLSHGEIMQKLILYSQQRMLTFKHYLNFLWFIEDNSVSLSTTYASIPSRKNIFMSVHNQEGFSTSQGEFISKKYNQDKLNQAIKIHDAYNKIAKNSLISKEVLQKQTSREVDSINFHAKDYDENNNYNSYNRIERAFRFSVLARKTSFLPFKITLNIPVLECLFSTDASEATQKVSERVAFYLGDSADERKSIFKLVNDGYRLRSNYIHGGMLHKTTVNFDDQKKLSKEIDDIIRRVLTKAIMDEPDFFLNEETLKLELKNLIFSR